MHHHRRSPYPMLPVPVALEIVLENILPGSPIEVPLESSLGLVLSDEIISEEPMPPFPASIMDGYAVQAKDCPGNLTVLGLASAGFVSPMKVGEGKIIQITTGSPIPEGADAVVMVEETELVEKLEDGTQIVKINTSALPGQNIRTVGCDIQLGQVIVGAGEVIGPAEIGLLAGAGVTRVMVHRPPVVGILSTGDELVEPSIKPKNGCVVLLLPFIQLLPSSKNQELARIIKKHSSKGIKYNPTERKREKKPEKERKKPRGRKKKKTNTPPGR
eukprot:TRINITY_DN10097_c0_g2_i1.p1 TRINITY_DN10097_c0_g2~~TRINITY_DN10097_c0_g2_i1.p1  ORF type:complete len:286 (+),score=72.73 TRINITY_DN10097_c0_g2_i1:40-858(+)